MAGGVMFSSVGNNIVQNYFVGCRLVVHSSFVEVIWWHFAGLHSNINHCPPNIKFLRGHVVFHHGGFV
jgi:hypothetical protein